MNFVSGTDKFYLVALIVFIEKDLHSARLPLDDPLIIKLQIDKSILRRVLLDCGSNADVLF